MKRRWRWPEVQLDTKYTWTFHNLTDCEEVRTMDADNGYGMQTGCRWGAPMWCAASICIPKDDDEQEGNSTVFTNGLVALHPQRPTVCSLPVHVVACWKESGSLWQTDCAGMNEAVVFIPQTLSP